MSQTKLPVSVPGGCLCGAIRYTITFPGHAEWPPQGVPLPPRPMPIQVNNDGRTQPVNAPCAVNLLAAPSHSASPFRQAILNLHCRRTGHIGSTVPLHLHIDPFAVIADPVWHSIITTARSRRFTLGV